MKTNLIIIVLIVSIPFAYGHPEIVGSMPGEYIPHEHVVDQKKVKQNFIDIVISVIVIAMLLSVVAVYSRDISKLFKKD